MIRNWRADASLEVTRRGEFPSPYPSDAGRLLTSYTDNHGNEYWIDHARRAIVQMGPLADSAPQAPQVGPQTRLTVAELRKLAMTAAERAHPTFHALRSTLHPREDNVAHRIYYFRWEDYSSPLAESAGPPFLQIGVLPDGTVVSFIDALAR